MRRLQYALLATVAAIGFASIASAADMPVKAPVMMAPAVFSWTGCYIGGQVGWAGGNTDAQSGPFPGVYNQTYSYDWDGFVGGGHVGCDLQTGQFVFGIVGDYEWANFGGNGIGSLGYTHDLSIDWTASLRGRVGYAMGQNLFYVTGGAAWAGVDITKAGAVGAAPFVTFSDTASGWTVGAGWEYAFARNFSTRIEYRYTDLGNLSFSNAAVNSQDTSDHTFHAVRIGLSYRFGGL